MGTKYDNNTFDNTMGGSGYPKPRNRLVDKRNS